MASGMEEDQPAWAADVETYVSVDRASAVSDEDRDEAAGRIVQLLVSGALTFLDLGGQIGAGQPYGPGAHRTPIRFGGRSRLAARIIRRLTDRLSPLASRPTRVAFPLIFGLCALIAHVVRLA